MKSQKISVVLSPETLNLTLSGFLYEPYNDVSKTLFVYSGISEMISGGTNGNSLLTDITIPILFTETYNDVGIYSEFDGLLCQKDIITNFLYSGTNQFNLNYITLYNTSGDFTDSYLDFTDFYVNWGDNTIPEQLTSKTISHEYLGNGSYVISLSGSNPWGLTVIEKPITVPLTLSVTPNTNGNITFTPQQGNWVNTPINYNYIYDLDSNNSVAYQSTSGWTSTPFNISGYTKSKINDLRRWGSEKYTVGYVFTKNNELYGKINSICPEYKSYTIEGIDYYDLTDGKTLYVIGSSGLTHNDIVSLPMTKNEQLLDFVMTPEIQSNVYVERGKYSPFEAIQRLGEVDNSGDLVRYGYGYYKINTI